MIKKCSGCGSILQSKDESLIGYTPVKDSKLCQRCFKLKNYNVRETTNLKYSNEDLLNIINKANKNAAIFFITDFLSINNMVIDVFKKVNHDNKYLVINKIDYIPYSIKLDLYSSYIKDEYKLNNDIILISAIKGESILKLNNLIKNYHESYICGFTNSGKSTIINKLCSLNNVKSNIISSLMPNTTLDLIKIKLDSNIFIYDTPGFVKSTIINDKTYPKTYLKPITIQVKEKDILSLDDVIYIENMGKENSFTFYVSNLLKIKKIYKENTLCNNEIKVEENSDLYLYGYGFINIKNKCTLKINTNDFEVHNSIFK